MGTSSFKLLIIRAYPNGKFLTIDTLKQPVILGRDLSSSCSISTQSQARSVESLLMFRDIIQSHNISRDHTRAVATAAVRAAENKDEFVERVREKVGFEVDVLTGEQEAKFVYMGVLQFLPVFDRLVLSVDIGGGSTEFVIGKRGKVVFCESVNLGHVSLSEKFGTCSGNFEEVLKMREYVRMVILEFGLVEKVKEGGFEVAVGSSGTIRAIEKAVVSGYDRDFVDNVGDFGGCKRDWRLSRGELKGIVERLCCGGDGEVERVRRERFFKRRSEFIVAGAVLLDEIFELLGIEEMEVSGYGLGEGIVADSLAKVFDGYDLNANARWRSVVRLAMRFNNKKRVKAGAQCASIAKDIFEGLRKCDKLYNNQVKLIASFEDKDLEYLEAACLLHNIGHFTSKKGYHKQSCHIIMNGDHLYGYSTDEIKLIALLTRFHRKKFPRSHHAFLEEFPEQAKQKFRVLCAIIRLSVILQQNDCVNLRGVDFFHSYEGWSPSFYIDLKALSSSLPLQIFKQELLVVGSSSSSNDRKDKFPCERDADHL
ncbi:Ppx-GppA phosphatase [Citrus sinensis]|nr:Ppx-GppA phosphatase [Citrus sinensis]